MIKITIFGHPTKDGTIKTSLSSTQMFTAAFVNGFRHIGYDVNCINAATCNPESFLEKTDIVLVHTYAPFWVDKIQPILKKHKENYLLSSSFMEVVYDTDIPFTYDNRNGKSHVINAPCLLDCLKIENKIKKTILLDHGWPVANALDVSEKILNTLSEKNYSVSKIGDPSLSPEKIIHKASFLSYLENTSQFENFIVTHKGSYNHSVVDMVARGTRVISPRGYVPKNLVELFNIPEFDTMDEMLNVLSKPYVASEWELKRDLCTDMSDAVNIMNEQFINYINRK